MSEDAGKSVLSQSTTSESERIDASNPYAVTTFELSKPLELDDPRFAGRMRKTVYALIVLMAFGTVLACFEIESILGSGPTMFVIGVILLFRTRRHRRRYRWFAWACFLFPLFVFGIINLMGWGPSDAQIPISLLCIAFVLSTSLALLLSMRSSDAAPDSAIEEVPPLEA